ncbi:hypothetical protein NXV12_20650 [Bacteroides thetaiotaomicron]|nr:hypothetical protein [Bacteroides thetaiotaomicron]
MFITEEDYKVVIGDNALKVISQVSPENRTNAEAEAGKKLPVIYGRNTTVRPFSLHRMNIGTASLSCTPATFHFTT